MSKHLNELSIISGIIGGTIVHLLGGMDAILHALIYLVMVDYVTGLLKAWKLRTIDSRIGFQGLITKILIFIVVAVSVEIERVLGSNLPLREAVIMFYLTNEGISFLENISVFIPLPKQLKQVFQQLKEKE
ncbi:phage holin family protein [Enterococcus sp. 669A]|uniref:Phage holin family protein n=1 Tax=Candidatus Enterococcus moelleringii TaxID=2815325 RepID=A0ABS3L972_9ENTE|nr:phage holin family protein [Enterococcus sp. 669A]MBO1306171.1 phage holin family protein [Enterococcus sp. 669A]